MFHSRTKMHVIPRQQKNGAYKGRANAAQAYPPVQEAAAELRETVSAKAMIKQIDRVIGDLVRQVEEFRKTGGQPICIGFVGVNSAAGYTSYEGEREWPTDGRKHKHPVQEAAEAERRLASRAASAFDEFQILRFHGGQNLKWKRNRIFLHS